MSSLILVIILELSYFFSFISKNLHSYIGIVCLRYTKIWPTSIQIGFSYLNREILQPKKQQHNRVSSAKINSVHIIIPICYKLSTLPAPVKQTTKYIKASMLMTFWFKLFSFVDHVCSFSWQTTDPRKAIMSLDLSSLGQWYNCEFAQLSW